MAELKINLIEGEAVPVPYYVGGGVNLHLLQFLTRRYYRNSAFKGAKKPSISGTTLKTEAYNIVYLINTIAEEIEVLDLDGGAVKVGTLDYLNIEYYQLEQVVEMMHAQWEIKGQSLTIYFRQFRNFIEFLRTIGVPSRLAFDAKIKSTIPRDQDDDFLSHTYGRSQYYETSYDPLIKREWMEYSEDYKGSVLSMSQYHSLWDTLYEDDPVYAVMAATMMQTFLRVGGVMQLPLKPNKLNPDWQRFAQMDKVKGYQELRYIKKGGGKGTCLVHYETMRVINEEYLQPFRLKRHELYLTKYLITKHAKNTKRTKEDKFLWLNVSGTPVTIRALQSAFKRASAKLGFNVTAHFMRHTGATQLLHYWSKANETTICDAHKTTIHAFLKRQLGHSQMVTTMYYIRTIEALMNEKMYVEFLPNALPAQAGDSKATRSAKASYEQAMSRYNEEMAA